MAMDYAYWRSHGRPSSAVRPIADLAALLRRHGYVIGIIGDQSHLQHVPPEDHTPFSAEGWPGPATYGLVYALDIMPPPAGHGLPSLAALGGQLFADRQANAAGARWIKYMNWTPAGGSCVHDSWKPAHARRPSDDKGHIHISARSDCNSLVIPSSYDPVAAAGGSRPAPNPQPAPPAPDWSRRLVMALPVLKVGASGTPVRRLQALLNVAGGNIAVDGQYGPATESAVRTVQAQAGIGDDGIAGPQTWATLLGVAG